MQNLIQSRRGASALVTVVALTPIIGFMALGAEAGSWYVTQRHAQGAADAAAYAGALELATILGGGVPAEGVVAGGKLFASQNGFCNSGDTGCTIPSDVTSQSVIVAAGDYSGGSFTTPPAASGNAVQALVGQTNGGYLTGLFGWNSITINTQAIALVTDVASVCALGLSTATGNNAAGLTLGGSGTLGGGGCALMSDGVVKYSSTVNVTGTNWASYGTEGCNAPAATCNTPGYPNALPHSYDMPYASNPLLGLNSQTFTMGSGCGGNCTSLVPGSYNNLTVNGNATYQFSPGIYSFSGNVNITGGTVSCPSCTCTGNPTATSGTTGVNIVLTGSAKFTINTANVTLCAGTSYGSPNSSLNGVLVDDQATGDVKVAGDAGAGYTVALEGVFYAPNANISWKGTSNISFTASTCALVIGETLDLTGTSNLSTYLSATNCVTGTVPQVQLIALVQ